MNNQARIPNVRSRQRWLWLLPWLLLACQLTGTPTPAPDEAGSATAEPTVTAAPVVAAETGLDRILFVGPDRNLYTIAPDGSDLVALTDDADVRGPEQRLYQHMTWSPASDQIAVVSLATGPGTVAADLFTIRPDGQERQTLFSSNEIAPFYLYWSPDGNKLTFLSNLPAENGLGLFQFALGAANYTLVERGQPFYWVWAPDSSQIFLHTGARIQGRLALLDTGAADEALELGQAPTSFQAPGWTPDGQLLLTAIEKESGGDALVLIDVNGVVTAELTDLPRDAAFVLAPDGAHVALTVRDTSFPTGSIGPLTLLPVADPAAAYTLPERLVVAYFWAPDGEKLLYFTLNRTGRQQTKPARAQGATTLLFDIFVHDLNSGQSAFIDTIEPTESLLNVIPFFDQYHHSATIWSPDSQSFVYPARVDDVDLLWLGQVAGGLPRELAPGGMAYWSWR